MSCAMRRLVVLGIVVSLFATAGSTTARSTAPPTAVGSGGAAASVDQLATEAAIDSLRRGENAVDAAVTAAAVLGVTEPFSCGIGGGGFMVIRTAKNHRFAHNGRDAVVTIDSRERAPAAMRPDSFFEGGVVLPFNAARYSGLSVGVPGTVQAWSQALGRYGTISLGRALQPAIGIARNGFTVDQTFVDQTAQNQDWFDDIPPTAALFLDPDGTPHDVGTTFRNPDLASTYELLARQGPDGFYRGALAEAIARTVKQPPVSPTANHIWRPGVMEATDLADYQALLRPPTHVNYRGYDVYSMGPPSSGGTTDGEALNILEGYDLPSMTREAAFHYYLEASRYSFADRNAYVADPDFFQVPVRGLLSKRFAATRRSLITERAATSPVAPGDPYPFAGDQGAGEAAVTSTRSGATTHLTVSDRKGNVVSYTFTIESIGGAALLVPGYGFLLNNELTDFNIDSLTHPNRVEGGKRPRSSMAPTIVLRRGKPFLALGSPGGSMIITTVLQLMVDRIDLGSSLPAALANPRASQRNTAATSAEPAFIQSPVASALTLRGHVFASTPEIGAATAIEFLRGNKVIAAAEPTRRGGGTALVVRPER
jgi:gamma-glutamyltranspeptidase/glutathione hydrolase